MTTARRSLVGLAAALTLTACSWTPVVSDNPSSTAGHRDGESIRDDFYAEVGAITEEAGGTWVYLDGSPFSPKDRDWFNPKACHGDESVRQLLLLVESGPTPDGPAAIKRMQSVLEARGMEATGYVPGKAPRAASQIYAESPNGFFVSYGTNDLKTSIRFGSECSSDPSMQRQVG